MHVQKSALNKCILLTFTAFLSACTGYGFGSYRTQAVASSEFKLAKSRNEFAYEDRQSRYTREEVIDYWGWPDTVEKLGYCDVLVYKNGISWAGFGVFAGSAPIPVAVPTGHYENRIYLQNNIAVGVVTEFGQIQHAKRTVCAAGACNTVEVTGQQPQVSVQQATKSWCTQRQ